MEKKQTHTGRHRRRRRRKAKKKSTAQKINTPLRGLDADLDTADQLIKAGKTVEAMFFLQKWLSKSQRSKLTDSQRYCIYISAYELFLKNAETTFAIFFLKKICKSERYAITLIGLNELENAEQKESAPEIWIALSNFLMDLIGNNQIKFAEVVFTAYRTKHNFSTDWLCFQASKHAISLNLLRTLPGLQLSQNKTSKRLIIQAYQKLTFSEDQYEDHVSICARIGLAYCLNYANKTNLKEYTKAGLWTLEHVKLTLEQHQDVYIKTMMDLTSELLTDLYVRNATLENKQLLADLWAFATHFLPDCHDPTTLVTLQILSIRYFFFIKQDYDPAVKIFNECYKVTIQNQLTDQLKSLESTLIRFLYARMNCIEEIGNTDSSKAFQMADELWSMTTQIPAISTLERLTVATLYQQFAPEGMQRKDITELVDKILAGQVTEKNNYGLLGPPPLPQTTKETSASLIISFSKLLKSMTPEEEDTSS